MNRLSSLASRCKNAVLTDPDSVYFMIRRTTPGNSFVSLLCINGVFSLLVRDLEASNYSDLRDVHLYCYSEHDPIDVLVDILKDVDPAVVHLEKDSPRFCVSQGERLTSSLPHITFVDITQDLRMLRSIKSAEEIECIKKAARCVMAGLDYAIRHIRLGMTETELSGLLTYGKMCAGSAWASYPEFVAFAENGCIGHHTACSSTVLKENSIVFVEIGATHGRYHAARMHTIYIGPDVPPWFEKLENAIRYAMKSVMVWGRPGTHARDIDRAMRNVVEAAFEDLGDTRLPKFEMMRRSGYSIGIGSAVDWADETIRLTPTSSDVLQENMVLHMIPWVHVEGKGAIGFSDVVRVTNDGLQSLYETACFSKMQAMAVCL